MAWLVLIFIVVPIAELYVIIKVGGWIGVGPTLAILILDSLLGAMLLRHQGRGAWLRFRQALEESRVPAKEVLDGALVIFGGALLLTPGFITDVVGLLLLIPPTRAIARVTGTRLLAGRVASGAAAAGWGFNRMRNRRAEQRAPGPAPGWPPPPGGPGGPGSGPRPGDIEGTAHELRDDEALPGGEGAPGPGEEPPAR